jgi:tRNA(fMet)-specific endonuclease VapC
LKSVAWERAQLDGESVIAQHGDRSVALSAITASELLHGVERAEGAQRRARRAAFIESLLETFEILPIDLEVSRVHARIWADLRARRELIGANDVLIAATPLSHGLSIATRNVRDFARVESHTIEQW